MENITIKIREISLEEAKNLMPNMLYKYRVWNEPYHNQILSTQEIFFSSPYSFEDESDCRFPIDHSCTLEEFTRRYRLNYKNMRGIKVMNDLQLDSLAKFLFHEEWSSHDKIRKKEDRYHQMFNSPIGIYCLCKTSDNISMWNKYGGQLSGFCVGTDFKRCFEMLYNNIIGGCDVEYLPKDTPPLKYIPIDLLSTDEVFRFFFESIRRKYNDWAFEDEYRLFKFMPTSIQNPISVNSNKRVFVVPKECIKEVIFGERIRDVFIEDIIQTCNNNGLHVVFKKAIVENGKITVIPF